MVPKNIYLLIFNSKFFYYLFLKGKDLSAHLNGDEAMALGAGFIAANMSHNFKVRPIWLIDGYNFIIDLEIKNLKELPENLTYNRNFTLFDYKQKIGSKKIVTFTYDKDLKFLLKVRNPYNESQIDILSVHYLRNITNNTRVFLKNTLKIIKFKLFS